MLSSGRVKLAHPDIPASAIRRAVAVLESGSLVQGEQVATLEARLCEYLGVTHAAVVSSGTAALHLALLASGIGPSDEVLIPAFTFPATANAVWMTGTTPVLVDVSLDDFSIDVSRLEESISPRTKAVVPVHEFGLPANMGEIQNLADKHGLLVVEDAACALGAEYNGRKIGALGNTSCFSFHPRKAITTGEGGVITTNDGNLASRLRSLRNHGIVQSDAGVDVVEPGLNYRLTDFQAALAIEPLQQLDTTIQHRREMATLYYESLGMIDGVTPPGVPSGRRHVYQTYHVLLDDGIDRDAVVRQLRTLGVESNFGAWALNQLTVFHERGGYSPEDMPNAVRAFRSGLALPMGTHVTSDDIQKVIRAVAEAVERCRAVT